MTMTKIKVAHLTDFGGESVVFVAMDSDGAKAFRMVLKEKNEWKLDQILGGQIHKFIESSDSAKIDFDKNHITWRLPPKTVRELIDKLDAMRILGKPCHQYIDISAPTATLVLSQNERFQSFSID